MVRPPFVQLAALLGMAVLLTCTPPAHAQKKDALIGTSWSGRETLPGYGPLTFSFDSDGNVTMVDARETVPGRYTRRGASITLTFFNGQAVYSGQIRGKTMSGTARNAARSWTWQISKEGGDEPPPSTESRPSVPSKPAPPESPQEKEAKAAALLKQAKDTIKTGNTSLGRVRLNLIVTQYPLTKAAAEAKELLKKLK
jgi:hypothetical protein